MSENPLNDKILARLNEQTAERQRAAANTHDDTLSREAVEQRYERQHKVAADEVRASAKGLSELLGSRGVKPDTPMAIDHRAGRFGVAPPEAESHPTRANFWIVTRSTGSRTVTLPTHPKDEAPHVGNTRTYTFDEGIAMDAQGGLWTYKGRSVIGTAHDRTLAPLGMTEKTPEDDGPTHGKYVFKPTTKAMMQTLEELGLKLLSPNPSSGGGG